MSISRALEECKLAANLLGPTTCRLREGKAGRGLRTFLRLVELGIVVLAESRRKLRRLRFVIPYRVSNGFFARLSQVAKVAINPQKTAKTPL